MIISVYLSYRRIAYETSQPHSYTSRTFAGTVHACTAGGRIRFKTNASKIAIFVKMGLEEALVSAGVQPGDMVCIADSEFEYAE